MVKNASVRVDRRIGNSERFVNKMLHFFQYAFNKEVAEAKRNRYDSRHFWFKPSWSVLR